MIKLNFAEMQQFQLLIKAIRADVPHHPQPARNFISLVRARVCAYLCQEIVSKNIKDIYIVRSPKDDVDFYAHM
ncbi:MAG: hypothetical protein U0L76_03690 [Ruminococcus sp.]|nr:hypothetical protein [Ruminococcus sp.]